MQKMSISMVEKKQVVDITKAVEARLPKGDRGVVTIFVPHTGAALTTANLDPGTDLDLLDFMEAIIPHVKWRHPHNPSHAPDHLLASLIGSNITIPFENGRLLTGTWQYVVLVEFDGPRERTVLLGR